jgi:hypothetical protein
MGRRGIYAYVHNDPLNRTDPFGLCDDPSSCGGSSNQVIGSSGSNPIQLAMGGGSGCPVGGGEICQDIETVQHPSGGGGGAVDQLGPSNLGQPQSDFVGPPASSFSGSLSAPLEPPAGVPPRNPPGVINGVPYSGHALDQMQNQGIPSSVTNQAVQSGTPTPSVRFPGTTTYYDPVNNVSVMRDNSTGTVITVTPGKVRP